MEFYFPGQRPQERVEYVFRRHWIIHLIALARFFFVGVLPTMGIFYLASYLAKSDFYPLLIAFALLLLVFAIQYSLVAWINDDLDFLVVTNERVIDITQISLLERENAEADLRQIQDVSGKTKGILGTVLNYGDVFVRTANDISVFDLHTVAHPAETASQILDYVKKGEVEKIQHYYKREGKTLKEKINRVIKGLFGD